MAVIPVLTTISWGWIWMLLPLVPFVYAPQPMRKLDQRVVAFGVALALAGVLEVVTKICDWCPYCIECWFQ